MSLTALTREDGIAGFFTSMPFMYTHNRHMGPHTLPAHMYTHADMHICAHVHPPTEPSPRVLPTYSDSGGVVKLSFCGSARSGQTHV